jgi:hypothetical protein
MSPLVTVVLALMTAFVVLVPIAMVALVAFAPPARLRPADAQGTSRPRT